MSLKFKLRTKLLLGFMAIVLVTCSLGILVFCTYMHVRKQYAVMHDDIIPVAFSLQEIKTEVTELCNDVYAYAQTQSKEHREDAITTLDHIKANLNSDRSINGSHEYGCLRYGY